MYFTIEISQLVMRFKKRYIPFLMFGVLFAVLRLEFFAFRKDNEAQAKYLKERNQVVPNFYDHKVNGRTIHYTHVGDENLPLVVLLHGSPGSSSAYLDYLADTSLTQKVQLVAVDRPGFGYSDYGKVEPSLEQQSLAIKPILEKYRKEKAILVGHSFGGPLIARMAMDYPQLIDGLVMVAASIDPDLEPKEWWRKPADWPLVRWLLPKSIVVCNQEIMPLDVELRKMMPLWEKITAATVVLQGEKDDLVPMENAHFAKKMLTNSKAVDIQILEGENHFILWSKQELIKKTIVDLLEKE